MGTNEINYFFQEAAAGGAVFIKNHNVEKETPTQLFFLYIL